MKNYFFLFLSLPFVSLAQDSCQLKRTTDPFTHQTRISTGFVSFPTKNASLSLSIDATATDIDFFFWITNDSKCFDDQSTAQINYDGDRMKGNFRNNGSMNCEGAFHINFRNTLNTPSNLQRITSKKINFIRLTGNNKTITDIVFTDAQKLLLMKMATCVVTASKTLIK